MAAGRGQVGLDVAGNVLPEGVEDGWGGIVGHDDARCAQETGHDARQRGPGAEFQDGFALDVERWALLGESCPRVDAIDMCIRIRIRHHTNAKAIPLHKLRQKQARVPEMVTKQPPVCFVSRVRQFDMQRLGQVWRRIYETVLSVAMLARHVIGKDDAQRRRKVVLWSQRVIAFESYSCRECHGNTGSASQLDWKAGKKSSQKGKKGEGKGEKPAHQTSSFPFATCRRLQKEWWFARVGRLACYWTASHDG